MKKLMTICVFVGVVCVLQSVAAADWKVVYQTDFSSDPGWITNNSDRYYWDPCDGTFVANQTNVNGGGYYAYHETNLNPGSFRLEWDIKMISVEYACAVTFGLYDTDLNTAENGSFVEVYFVREDRGLTVNIFLMNSENFGQDVFSAPTQYSLGIWYHVVVEYDALAETVVAYVTLRESGVELTTLSASNVGAFASDMTRVGTSNVREGNFQVTGAEATGKIDNVILSFCEPAGPVAYWSFDDPCNPGHDDSSNGNNGTVNGATSTGGICGNALDFDGINDFVLIPDSDSLDVTTAGTIIGWVKIPSSFPFPSQGVGFVNKMIHSTGLYSYEFTIGHDGPFFGGIGDGSDGKHVYCADDLRYNNPNFLFDDTWHQLAFTWDSQELKLYIDGQFENATNHTVNGAQVTDWDVTIGRRAYASSTNWKYFQGKIDEVRIYDRTLSACEIAELAAECEPEPIETILDFIEESVADETLAPVKAGKPGQGQLGALINMIEAAGNLIEADLPVDACIQLHDAFEKTDGLSPPESAPDFVAGEAAAELASMIEDLMAELGC